MWWWIEPMLYTGMMCAVLAAIAMFVSTTLYDSGNDKAYAFFVTIAIVLCIPFGIALVGGIINLVWNIFNWIWAPYI